MGCGQGDIFYFFVFHVSERLGRHKILKMGLEIFKSWKSRKINSSFLSKKLPKKFGLRNLELAEIDESASGTLFRMYWGWNSVYLAAVMESFTVRKDPGDLKYSKRFFLGLQIYFLFDKSRNLRSSRIVRDIWGHFNEFKFTRNQIKCPWKIMKFLPSRLEVPAPFNHKKMYVVVLKRTILRFFCLQKLRVWPILQATTKKNFPSLCRIKFWQDIFRQVFKQFSINLLALWHSVFNFSP